MSNMTAMFEFSCAFGFCMVFCFSHQIPVSNQAAVSAFVNWFHGYLSPRFPGLWFSFVCHDLTFVLSSITLYSAICLFEIPF